jgi:hypothetical protein
MYRLAVASPSPSRPLAKTIGFGFTGRPVPRRTAAAALSQTLSQHSQPQPQPQHSQPQPQRSQPLSQAQPQHTSSGALTHTVSHRVSQRVSHRMSQQHSGSSSDESADFTGTWQSNTHTHTTATATATGTATATATGSGSGGGRRRVSGRRVAPPRPVPGRAAVARNRGAGGIFGDSDSDSS